MLGNGRSRFTQAVARHVNQANARPAIANAAMPRKHDINRQMPLKRYFKEIQPQYIKKIHNTEVSAV
ncbi:hypothetical protein T11_14805 [Trichinella zimbabwensis]|uniref:Uncharacterized protein n=1 Tax=Trichinella zimbabwensis TaxID=268475 RepID=A0A0V1GK79_9BILA|nr:hypothetical protein T11_14805 [Trichinella zimbabwensis]